MSRQGAPVRNRHRMPWHPTVVHPRHSARLVRQQRLDDRPLLVTQLVSAHETLLFRKVESEPPPQGESCLWGQSLVALAPDSRYSYGLWDRGRHLANFLYLMRFGSTAS